MEQVESKRRMETIAVGKNLGCNDRPQHDHHKECDQPFPIRRKAGSSPLKLWTDQRVAFVHRSSP